MEQPLIIASYFGHKEIVLILLTYGVNINHRDFEGNNALDVAKLNNHKEIEEIIST